MALIYRFRKPALSEAREKNLLLYLGQTIGLDIKDIETEYCFYVDAKETLSPAEMAILQWLLCETFEPENFSSECFLNASPEHLMAGSGVARNSAAEVFEVGPRMNFTTAWSTNAVSVCHSCGITKIIRVERSRRFKLVFGGPSSVSTRNAIQEKEKDFLDAVHDRMTECPYPERLWTFETGINPEPVYEVKVIEQGRSAIEEISRKLGLGLDGWDIDYYFNLFAHALKRNPTNVECFDLGQSNSEHSRHWFFRGKLVIDGLEIPHTLMEIIKDPYEKNPNNSIIAFGDNSSAIRGYRIRTIIPDKPGSPSPFREKELTYHIVFTAETHNFPSGVAPFPGAETGTGGRIRDVQAVG
ncbi:MAG: phosphoribosylformylglycinamidine synthase, partial [Thermodesulfovibrionales bacterium]